MVGTSWLVWSWPGTTTPKSSDPWAKTDRFDASNRILSITSARPVSRGFLRDTSRGWLSNGLCRRRYPRYLPRSGNFELPVANFTRARTVRERMNPLNATPVKDNLTVPRHRH